MERERGETPANIFTHLQETVQRAIKQVLKVPRRVGAQGEPEAYIFDITAQTEQNVPGEKDGKVMINSKEAAEQQAAKKTVMLAFKAKL